MHPAGRAFWIQNEQMTFDLQIEQVVASCTWHIRQRVLYPHGSLKDVLLDGDFDATHFGAYHRNQLVGVISLFAEGTEYQFRKFAVLPDYQRCGIGSELMQETIQFVKQWHGHLLWCNARVDAVPFYGRFGLAAVGTPYDKGGITYIRLEKQLI